MQDYSTAIVTNASPQKVFDAVNNVSEWWQGEIQGDTKKLNDEFTYRMGDMHYSKQLITETVPDTKVVWRVIESNLSFADTKDEWTGTEIRFEISKSDNGTQLRFTHAGLQPKMECYHNCSNAWQMLIQGSLHSLIETGNGKKVF